MSFIVKEAVLVEILERSIQLSPRVRRFRLRQRDNCARQGRGEVADIVLVGGSTLNQPVDLGASPRDIPGLQTEKSLFLQQFNPRQVDSGLVIGSRGALVELGGARQISPLSIEIAISFKSLAALANQIEKLTAFKSVIEMLFTVLKLATIEMAAGDVQVRPGFLRDWRFRGIRAQHTAQPAQGFAKIA